VPLITGTRERLYAAERRFDLITLLTIISAYAVLFGVMRLFRWELGAFALMAGLVTCVGAGQAFLFQGAAPRGASVLVGGVYFALVAAVLSWMEGHRIESAVCLLFALSIEGAIVGYFCGVLVGGVFMVAELLRLRLARIGKRPAGPDAVVWRKD
jgi:hypothetical protein